METEMEYDDVAWEKSEEIKLAWRRRIVQEDSQYALAKLLRKSRGGTPETADFPPSGSFNLIFLIIFKDGGKAIVRLAKPATSMFPEEKTPIEVATMRYIQAHTKIPVPLILDWGTQKDCPFALGPFIVMEWVESDTDLVDELKDKTLPPDESIRLDPNIPEVKLRKIYSKLAEVLVQLSGPTADRIGALSQVGDNEWVVDKGPITYGLSEMVWLGTLPRSKAPSGPFDSSASYFEFLADLHVQHLAHQRNDAINGSDDCRRKYVARQLFRKLAKENKLAWPTTGGPQFRLWNDDFRPTNVLAEISGENDFEVRGVVDWEWTYFAPPEFTYSPPWWLLLKRPEKWSENHDDWVAKYEQKLDVFLDELSKVEDDYIARKLLEESNRLSKRMRKCWDDGDFWVFYAIRHCFSFDYIFWHKICPRFFGFGAKEWRKGLELLGDEQKKEMEELVKKKIQEMKTRELVWDYDGPEEFPFEEDEKKDEPAAEKEEGEKKDEPAAEKEEGEKKDEPAAEKEETASTDTVSRTEFESLKEAHEKLEKENEKLKEDQEKLKAWIEERFRKLGVKEEEEAES